MSVLHFCLSAAQRQIDKNTPNAGSNIPKESCERWLCDEDWCFKAADRQKYAKRRQQHSEGKLREVVVR